MLVTLAMQLVFMFFAITRRFSLGPELQEGVDPNPEPDLPSPRAQEHLWQDGRDVCFQFPKSVIIENS